MNDIGPYGAKIKNGDKVPEAVASLQTLTLKCTLCTQHVPTRHVALVKSNLFYHTFCPRTAVYF